MKLRKLLAVTAVAATMTAAFAVNAMAEENLTLNAGSDFTYDAKTGIITLTTDKKPSAAPYTMLVVASNEEGLDKEIADTDIKQIDQADAAFATINVGTLAEGTYEIRLGGDGQVRWGTLTVAPVGNPNYDDGTVKLGDANCNGEIAGDDATIALKYTIGEKNVSKNTLQALDTNDNGQIAGDDATIILKYTVGERDVLGTKTISEKTNFVPVAE